MIYTISIPARDYKALEKYLKKNLIAPETMELLGREYETGDEWFAITAKVLANQPAIHYSVSDGEQTFHKIIRTPVCYFEEYGLSIAFDIDRGYE